MRPSGRPVKTLEVLLRQIGLDPELDAYPEVRRNLESRVRGLQYRKLDQDEHDQPSGGPVDGGQPGRRVSSRSPGQPQHCGRGEESAQEVEHQELARGPGLPGCSRLRHPLR